jgi:hypothetical protein
MQLYVVNDSLTHEAFLLILLPKNETYRIQLPSGVFKN